ncbi:hypothetical protein QWY85_06070 [Neolewinella lacunae]|uniref:Uncharacterized protein n=1 Tax=Neolewinella lacunae TaxID=1517758 RepID=A0A923T8F8_9BACT|nr:hypothetical protein [Neolewinella lacunae]MBC6994526.1 hypothetical protein [Neolewinella lacunae]MDN3634219.1 hypothetical protein [Neolewinella lacunae]
MEEFVEDFTSSLSVPEIAELIKSSLKLQNDSSSILLAVLLQKPLTLKENPSIRQYRNFFETETGKLSKSNSKLDSLTSSHPLLEVKVPDIWDVDEWDFETDPPKVENFLKFEIT